MKYQLTLKDDPEFKPSNNPESKESSSMKEEPSNFNPSITIERSRLKKHNSVAPIRRSTESLPAYKRINSQEVDVINIKRLATKRRSSFSEIALFESMSSSRKKIEESATDKCRLMLRKILDSNFFIVFMTLCTLFTLFANDIQFAWCRHDVDEPFDIVDTLMIGIFTMEIILNCFARREYIFSFFFWLDVIATISLIQDVSYMFDPLIEGNAADELTFTRNFTRLGVRNQATNALSKVSSASRATRVLRIIRIIRLIRIVKLYKTAVAARANAEKRRRDKIKQKKLKEILEHNSSSESSRYLQTRPDGKLETIQEHNSQVNDQNSEIVQGNYKKDQLQLRPSGFFGENITAPKLDQTKSLVKQITNLRTSDQSKIEKKRTFLERSKVNKYIDNMSYENLVKETKISKVITESITKKVIIIILSMLVIIPVISEDFYGDDSLMSYNILAKYMSNFLWVQGMDYFGNSTLKQIVDDVIVTSIDPNYPIVNISSYQNLYWVNPNLTTFEFRKEELKSIYSPDGGINIVYSVLTESKLDGLLNILRTIFVCICLALAAIFFESDAQHLVLEPLEVMMEIVEKVSKDPINAKNVENLQSGIKATITQTKSKEQLRREKEDQFEVIVIKDAIIKISALLAIGFGEAGGEIIRENLSSGQELNPMLKGKHKTAIFGFCDIRQFSDINLALQEDTMLFVNEVAEIVHSCVDKYGGAANKNIGDAFLNVWKFKEINEGRKSVVSQGSKKENISKVDLKSPQAQRIADMAVLGFLNIIIKINREEKILSYRSHKEILERIPNFSLKMGFGLHLGYGIEGAIGSSYKIDASYLSPNVNISARLESATRQFGVSILISGILYDCLSPEIKKICRYIDCVKVKGSELPLKLYTVDVNHNLTPKQQKVEKIMNNKAKRQMFQEKKDELKLEVEMKGSVAKVVLAKKSFKELLNTGKGKKFYVTWDEGMLHYKNGNWKIASDKFMECLKLDPSDGPAKTLYEHLKSRNFIAPDDWEGVRVLPTK